MEWTDSRTGICLAAGQSEIILRPFYGAARVQSPSLLCTREECMPLVRHRHHRRRNNNYSKVPFCMAAVFFHYCNQY
jgi:hypothetical protein